MAEASLNNTEVPICPYFLNSICRFGDKCHFSHRLSTPRSRELCKFYMKGKCRFGDNCWNRHSPDDNNLPSVHPEESRPSRTHPGTRIFYSKPNESARHLPVPPPRNEDHRPHNSQWDHAPESIPASSKCDDFFLWEPVEKTLELCADFVNGKCVAGDQCVLVHGDICEVCLKPCLNPLDRNQQKQHRETCKKELKCQREVSAAKQRSMDKACGICLDVVLEKNDANQRKFGILENCNHTFCFGCIMKWRRVKRNNSDIDSFEAPSISKACPECRISSDFVAASPFWFDTEDDKKKLIADHKAYLMTKHCKAFKRGDGYCPNGSLCYHLHMLRNGQKVILPAPSPLDEFPLRDLDFMSRLMVMDFWDRQEEIYSSDSDDDFDELDLLYNLDFEIMHGFEF